jgi:hypothetical protein
MDSPYGPAPTIAVVSISEAVPPQKMNAAKK